MNTVSPNLGQHRHRRLPLIAGSIVRCLAIAAALSVATLIAAPTYIHAAPAAPPRCPTVATVTCGGGAFEYGHSWYVNNTGAMTTWASYAASVENKFCLSNGSGTFLDVLDFGRPGSKSAS